jgi:hypothetical protein
MNPSQVSAENIVQRAFEPVQNLVKPTEGDALLAAFQPKNRRRREPQLLRKLSKRHFATLLSEEFRQFLVERRWHPTTMRKSLFRMRNDLD